jgi:hypothetical protein
MLISLLPARRLAIACVCALLLAIAVGCGTSKPVLSVSTLDPQRAFQQRFTQAYTSRDAAGDYQVVLLNDPIDAVSPGDAGKPLTAAKVPPLREVLHIRVLWRPMSGAKPDSPAATNASLHWYVLSGPTAEGTSMIHYAGTAFVAVVPNGPGAEVTVRNGRLRAVEQHGELVDPLKDFAVSGRFDAVADDQRLARILTDVKSAVAEAKATASSANKTEADTHD